MGLQQYKFKVNFTDRKKTTNVLKKVIKAKENAQEKYKGYKSDIKLWYQITHIAKSKSITGI